MSAGLGAKCVGCLGSKQRPESTASAAKASLAPGFLQHWHLAPYLLGLGLPQHKLDHPATGQLLFPAAEALLAAADGTITAQPLLFLLWREALGTTGHCIPTPSCLSLKGGLEPLGLGFTAAIPAASDPAPSTSPELLNLG